MRNDENSLEFSVKDVGAIIDFMEERLDGCRTHDYVVCTHMIQQHFVQYLIKQIIEDESLSAKEKKRALKGLLKDRMKSFSFTIYKVLRSAIKRV